MNNTLPPSFRAFAADARDAAWFAANPRRTHRLRPPSPGERNWASRLAPARYGAVPFVAVRRFVGGCWLILGWAAEAPADQEEAACAIFDLLRQRGAAGYELPAAATRAAAMSAPTSRAAHAFTNDDEASADDCRWFAANPQRAHRLRPPTAGELEWLADGAPDGGGRCPAVAVRQLQPGVRVRIPGWTSAPPLNTEELAHAIFDLLTELNAGGGGSASPAIVTARAASMRAVVA